MKKISPHQPLLSMEDFSSIQSQWFHDLISSLTSLSMGMELLESPDHSPFGDPSMKTILRESRERLSYHIQCLRQLSSIHQSSSSSLVVLKNYLKTLGLTLWYCPSLQNSNSFFTQQNSTQRDHLFLTLGLWLSKKITKKNDHLYLGSHFLTLWMEESSWNEDFLEKKNHEEKRILSSEGIAFQKVPMKPLFLQQSERDVLLTGKSKEEGERIGYALYAYSLCVTYGLSLELFPMDNILAYVCSAVAYYEGFVSRSFNKILSPKEQNIAWELSFWLLSRLNGVSQEEFEQFPYSYYEFWLEKTKKMDRGPCYLNFPPVSVLTLGLFQEL